MEQTQPTLNYRARNLRYLLLIVLIFWAGTALLARYLLSDIAQYAIKIEQWVAEKTPYQLSIGQLQGRWLIASPVIELKDVVLYQTNNDNTLEQQEASIIKISHLAIQIDIIESIFTLSPRIKQLLINGAEFGLVQNASDQKITLKGLALVPQPASNTYQQIKKIVDDFVFTSEQIYLNDIHIDLDLTKLQNAQLKLNTLTLDNEWLNHEVTTYVTLDDGSELKRGLRFSSVFQGNPLVFENFSARGFLEVEKNDLSFWLKKITIPGISLANTALGVQTWFTLKQGALTDLRLSIDASDLQWSQGKIPKSHHIQALSTVLALQGRLDLAKVFDKQYLSLLKYQHATLQIKNLDLEWDDFHINNFSAVAEQLSVVKVNNPLQRQWHDFEVIEFPSGVEDSSQKLDVDEKPINTNLYRASVSHLPLVLLKKISPFINVLEAQQKKIDDASVQGALKNLQLAMYITDASKPEIYASANARNIGMSNIEKIPAISGVDFYAELAPTGLGIELTTENANVAEDFYLFRKDLDIASVEGNLFLERLSGDIVVHSDIVELKNEWISASASLSASIPNRFYSDGSKEIPAWSLQVSLQPIPATQALMFFPGKLPPSFLNWADNFLLDGSVEGDVMLFAFTKKREPDTFFLLDGDLQLQGGKLDYLPEKWPALNEVNAHVLVHNDQIKATVPAASMFDSRLYNATVFIPSYLNENLPRIQILGNVTGSLQDVQKLFLESELKYSLGTVVEDWVLHGNQNSTINMDLPISDSPNHYESKLEVDLSVADALIAVPSVGLGVKELSSNVHYSLKEGLSAKTIEAKFFDKPVQGSIKTQHVNDEQVIQIFAEGDVSSEDLLAWEDFWMFNNLQGSTHFNAIIAVGTEAAIEQVLPTISKKDEIVVANLKGKKSSKKIKEKKSQENSEAENGKANINEASIVRVDVMSDLKDLSVTLPGAYAKKIGQENPSRLQLDVFPESMIYRLDYGKQLGISAKTVGDDFERARIHFGEGSFVLPSELGITVSGRIDELDFDSWLAYFEKNLFDEDSVLDEEKNSNIQTQEKPSSNPAVSNADPASILHKIELTISNFIGFDQVLKNLAVKVTREPFVWRVELENEVLSGVIYVPDEDLIGKDNPIVANLNYLKLSEEQFASNTSLEKSKPLPEGETEEVAQQATDELSPDDVSFMKLDIANVTLGKTKHGRWQLDIFPDDNGVDFKIHQLNYGLMAINGSGRWDYREDNSVTRFKGHLRTSAVTKIFSALSLRPSSKSKGLMAIDIRWPGSPLDFDSDTMKGTAGLEIFDGSIVEIDINSKKFKALGIFNLGIITDVLTLRIFKKIGKGIDEALSGSGEKTDDAAKKNTKENK